MLIVFCFSQRCNILHSIVGLLKCVVYFVLCVHCVVQTYLKECAVFGVQNTALTARKVL